MEIQILQKKLYRFICGENDIADSSWKVPLFKSNSDFLQPYI